MQHAAFALLKADGSLGVPLLMLLLKPLLPENPDRSLRGVTSSRTVVSSEGLRTSSSAREIYQKAGFTSILWIPFLFKQGGLGGLAELARCCFHNSSHNGKLSMEGHGQGLKNLCFQDDPVCRW